MLKATFLTDFIDTESNGVKLSHSIPFICSCLHKSLIDTEQIFTFFYQIELNDIEQLKMVATSFISYFSHRADANETSHEFNAKPKFQAVNLSVSLSLALLLMPGDNQKVLTYEK